MDTHASNARATQNDGNKVGVSTTYVSVDPRNATRSYAANVDILLRSQSGTNTLNHLIGPFPGQLTPGQPLCPHIGDGVEGLFPRRDIPLGGHRCGVYSRGPEVPCLCQQGGHCLSRSVVRNYCRKRELNKLCGRFSPDTSDSRTLGHRQQEASQQVRDCDAHRPPLSRGELAYV